MGNLLVFAAETSDLTVQWWITGAGVLVYFILLFGVTASTQAGVIARATTKEAIRQPVFLLLMALGLILLLLNTFLPFFSMGDDVKMLMDCGLATILICSLLLAVWSASTSIADEIEGKTAMTLLSKPINRRQFIIGKYLGILKAVVWLMLPLVITFLLLVYFKVGYDAREASQEAPTHADRMAAVWLILPGILLIYMEVAILTAISVAISTRLPMMVNMIICFGVYIIGHLTPNLVQAKAEGLEFVKFTGQLIATILPNLDNFNMSPAVATGTVVPPVYIGHSALSCLLYSGIAILVAFILFEDRDLA